MMLLESGDVVRALLYRKGEEGKREKTGRIITEDLSGGKRRN
jgi:hypothetical protein